MSLHYATFPFVQSKSKLLGPDETRKKKKEYQVSSEECTRVEKRDKRETREGPGQAPPRPEEQTEPSSAECCVGKLPSRPRPRQNFRSCSQFADFPTYKLTKNGYKIKKR